MEEKNDITFIISTIIVLILCGLWILSIFMSWGLLIILLFPFFSLTISGIIVLFLSLFGY